MLAKIKVEELDSPAPGHIICCVITYSLIANILPVYLLVLMYINTGGYYVY